MIAGRPSKLGLGTVQFGLDYGISNPDGRTSAQEVRRILDIAADGGIDVVDTASQYGQSEQVLGELLPPAGDFRIVTKTPTFGSATITGRDADRLEQKFLDSLHKLRQPSVYALLLHHSEDLLAPGGHLLLERMAMLKTRGLARKIGVSTYTPAQIDRVIEGFVVDLIQAPLNVLDQRLLHGGQLDRMRGKGIEFHARSVFLQGLLLMEPQELPPYFSPWREHLLRFRSTATAEGLEPMTMALRFVTALPQVDIAVCGVNRGEQLAELLQASRLTAPLPSVESFALADTAILDPSRWQK